MREKKRVNDEVKRTYPRKKQKTRKSKTLERHTRKRDKKNKNGV